MTGGDAWTAPGVGGDGPRTRPEVRYQRLGSLGSGAMGTVHLGWDAWLERNVALKVPVGPPGSLAEVALAREATLAARLEHPSIAAIHDVGTDEDGRSFFVMRLVRGRTLGALVAAGERAAAVRAVRVAADAAAHAHERGVVHRDLSPANVLVGAHGDVAVIDWGVAAATGDASAALGVGTPGFSAPEQLAGAGPQPSADVWSLGSLLRLAAGDAPPPELQAIVERATSEDPAARYPDAGALADDLVAWEDGRRVSAFAYAPTDLLLRAVRAWRVPLGVGALAAIVLAAQAGWTTLRIRDERDRAVLAEQRALTALASATTRAALAAWRAGDEVRAARLADEALALGPDPVAVGLRAATADLPVATELGRAAFAACPRLRLPGDGHVALCLFDDRMVAWPALPAFAEVTAGWTLPGIFVDVRRDGDALFALDSLRRLRVVDVHTGALLREDPRTGEFVHPELPIRFDLNRLVPLDDPAWRAPCGLHSAVTVADDGRRWVACGDGAVWRLGDEAPVRPPGPEVMDALATVAGGVWGASHHGGLVRLDGPVASFDLGEPPARFAPFPGAALLLANGRLGRLRVIDARTGRQVLDLGQATAAAVAGPDTVVVRDGEALVHLQLPSALPVRSWRIAAGLSCVAWGPLGIYAGDSSGAVHLLDPTGRAPDRVARWQDRVVKAVDVDATGVVVSAMGVEGVSRLTPDLSARAPIDVGPARLRRVVIRADGSVVGASMGEGFVRVAVGGDVLYRGPTIITDLMLADDGETVVFSDAEGVWHMGPDDVAVRVSDAKVERLAQRGGDLLSSVGQQVTVTTPGGARTWTQPSPVTALRWVDDGRVLTGGLDGVVRLYTADGALLAELPAHDDRVGALALSPDGGRAVSVGWDGRVQVLALAGVR